MDTNTEKFLLALWGIKAGEHVTAFVGVKDDEGFKNVPVTSVSEAVRLAAKYDAEGRDVYMSCAQFKDHSSRKQVNAACANAFWLDLDCGEGKSYPTKKAAYAALKSFVEQTKMPSPHAVVDSGNGLHVYWFGERIPADTWNDAAEKLKALTHYYGLWADDSRTADSASVLRLPGTRNYKQPGNPKPVVLKRFQEVHRAE